MTQVLYAFAKVRVSLSNYFLEQTSSRSGDPVENDTGAVKLSLRRPLPRAAGAVEVRSIKIFTL